MKITKLVHSCLLVELPAPVNRTALFDPGVWSSVDIESLVYLDDIIVTHSHPDHFDAEIIKKLVAKFPDVHITATDEVVERLNAESIPATSAASEGIIIFNSPHEDVRPMLGTDPPQEIGIHYYDTFTDPGDSHSFNETKAVLALPVQAPWGSTMNAIKLGLRLKPKYIVPVHDWHWQKEARESIYESMEERFAKEGITFIKAVNGEPFVLDV